MNNFEQQKIAVGRTAEIYHYEDGKILKLFYSTTPLEWIEMETTVGPYIEKMKLPVPRYYERIKVNDREGIIYEKVEGPTLLHDLATKPWRTARYARMAARLHEQVNAIKAPENIQTQKEFACIGVLESDKLPRELKKKIHHLLDSLPEGNQLCHGDFHPSNIILSNRGPIIIDWMTASQGEACGDVARTSIILEAAKISKETPMRWLLEIIRKLFLETYLKTYFQLRPIDKNQFLAWRAIMAASYIATVSTNDEEMYFKNIIEQGIGSMGIG